MNLHPHELATIVLNEIARNEARRRPRTYPHIRTIRSATLAELDDWFTNLRPPRTMAHIVKFELITKLMGELK